MTILPTDLSSIASLPNGRVVAFTTDWNTAALLATRVDDPNFSPVHLFDAGNKLGQNPSRFAWKVASNGRLYILFTTYTLPVGAGFATAGLKLRSTTDGETWTEAVSVMPDVSVGFACTPATQICGYLQPGLEIAPNGTMLATALKTTDSTHMALKTSVSTNGSTWSEPGNLNVTTKFSNSEETNAFYYSRSDYINATVTADGFALFYPFVVPPVAPVMFSDIGMASARLTFTNLQSWENPTNAQYVPVSASVASGNRILGPYLAFSAGKLTAAWFTRFPNADVKLLVTNFDVAGNSWSTPTESFICNACTLSNDIVRQKDRFISTPTHITIPFVVTPALNQSSAVKALMTVTITGGVPAAAATQITYQSQTTDVKLLGAFEQANGSLSLVVREDFSAFLVNIAGSGKTVTKIKDVASTFNGVHFSISAVPSANGSMNILTQEYGAGTSAPTVFEYFRAINQTKPKFFGVVLVSGSAKIGKTLQLGRNFFDEASGTPVIAYQWFRCPSEVPMPGVKLAKGCVAISKATAKTYKLVSSDKSKYILARITATNPTGSTILYTDSTGKVL
jgi:hypothetical protein